MKRNDEIDINKYITGNRISLISKKSIRYEGTLYSINEADATVALADVKSYGTEGRDKLEPMSAYVPPQDAVHPYLLFRGCDIKDLHVHEPTPPPAPVQQKPPEPTVESPKPQPKENIPSTSNAVEPTPPSPELKESIPTIKTATKEDTIETTIKEDATENTKRTGRRQQPRHNTQYNRSYNNPNRRSRKNDYRVGYGSSLLNRKERGAVDVAAPTTGDDFDFETSASEFQKNSNDNESPYPETNAESCYSKDDFFDSISCDTLDKQSGYDTRLRGAAERSLNTETFGAVSLGSGRRGGRRRNNRGRGAGRGRGSGSYASSGSWRK